MNKAVNGVDGCKAGWVVWHLADQQPVCHIVEKLIDALSLMRSAHSLIDIPIGFSDASTPDRLCDKAARQLLGRRASSVFPVPCREAAYASSYLDACEVNQAALGKKLSKQSWYILPKVIQADVLLTHYPNLILRESHPEVVFTALNGAPLEYNKKSPEGEQQRLAIIEKRAPQWMAVLDHQLKTIARKTANRDDIIDAFALMLIAREWPYLSTLPVNPDKDANGRVREIVYFANDTRASGLS
ncbi:DUF429 domain-containing protein [Vibrio sp. JPW-9-11-11]|uniref:DUF429 domain-containing protein n=1 Tax=Vibrio sp. JPW-9-11-11 TaxID=1416532 RepID=UPI0015933E11|nr:DUF429 domain-containing protein [Vibrio sp. JPW-9-11-11]NVD06024.1 DUF429 domain-containing protein [Vibrio sp. JPW-9-11-11]